MTEPRVNVDEAEEALEQLENAVKALEKVTESSEVRYDFRAQIDQLNSERRRLKDSLDEAGVENSNEFTLDEEKLKDSVEEFAAMRGLELEEAVDNLLQNEAVKDDLIPLYKVYLNRKEELLPKDKELESRITEYLEENTLE